jgi:hypothetical protein
MREMQVVGSWSEACPGQKKNVKPYLKNNRQKKVIVQIMHKLRSPTFLAVFVNPIRCSYKGPGPACSLVNVQPCSTVQKSGDLRFQLSHRAASPGGPSLPRILSLGSFTHSYYPIKGRMKTT